MYFKAQTRQHMILEILAHVGIVDHNGDLMPFQSTRRSNPRELENLGRVEGPSGQDDLSARLGRLNGNRPFDI